MIHAETRPLFGSAINDFLEVPLVIRMGSIDDHLHVWTYRAFAFEDAKDLIGPVEFPARNVLAETPSLAQSLRLRQIHLAPPKPLLGLLAFRTFPGFAQRALEGGHRGRIDGFCDCGDRALSGHEISSGPEIDVALEVRKTALESIQEDARNFKLTIDAMGQEIRNVKQSVSALVTIRSTSRQRSCSCRPPFRS
jgi:hypothetical protein